MSIFITSNSHCQITFLKDNTNSSPKTYGYSSFIATSPALCVVILGIFKSITNLKAVCTGKFHFPTPRKESALVIELSPAQSNSVLYYLVGTFLFIHNKIILSYPQFPSGKLAKESLLAYLVLSIACMSVKNSPELY